MTSISTKGCLIEGCAEVPGEAAVVWLKFPGRVPIRSTVERTAAGELVCAFVQPLYPSDVEALLKCGQPRSPTAPGYRARCTLL